MFKCSRCVGFVILVVARLSAAGDVAESPTAHRFGDAESLKVWSFSNGPEWPGAKGGLTWSSDAGHKSPGAAKLRFDFSEGGNYVAAIVPLPIDPAVRAVRLWLKKPGTNQVIFRATDQSGQCFQKGTRYVYSGWQQVYVPLDGWTFHWGGQNDGKVRGSFRDFHILFEADGDTKTGAMLIDDVELLTDRADSPPGVVHSTYIAAAFEPREEWTVGSANQGSYTFGKWQYGFPEGVDQIRLHREFSFFGKPQAMTLVIESDGSGHELRAVLGSHFQMFERTLGTLAKKGPMEFSVPLGNLSTWRHFGGEDDGLVRYPIRLLHLALVKKGEPPSGTVNLKTLQVKTAHDADQPIEAAPVLNAANDARAGVTLWMYNLRPEPVKARLEWSIHTIDGRLRSHTVKPTLPVNGIPARFSQQLSLGDANAVEAKFLLRAPDAKPVERSVTFARAPADAGSSRLDPANPMGVGLYLYRFHGHPDYREKIKRVCELAQRAGVKWTREEFHWDWIETAKGEFDWSYFDYLVDTAAEHGISVYGLMCYWTQWTRPNTQEGFGDYCDYLATAVERYKDRIKHWEIWNEPNVFFWSGTREQYVTLLNMAYDTVKRVDPDAQVLGCSTAGIDMSFIKYVVENGGKMDALTVHPYRGELNTPRFIQELHEARRLAGGKDVWITEMGWPSHVGGHSERTQAGYVARTYLSAFASNAVRSVSWYDFREDGEDPFYNEHHFGLVRNDDMAPKMGYAALATVGRLAAGRKCARTHDFGPGLLGFDFVGNGKQVTAIWATGATRLVSVKVDDADVRFIDLVGDRIPVKPDGGRANLLLQDGLPVYVAGAATFDVDVTPPPVRVKVEPSSVHPGDEVHLHIVAAQGELANATGSWSLPPGWRAARDGNPRHWVLHVPEAAGEGKRTMFLVLTVDETETRVPVSVTVTPALIRV